MIAMFFKHVHRHHRSYIICYTLPYTIQRIAFFIIAASILATNEKKVN